MSTPRIVGYWENWFFKGSNWKNNASAVCNVMAQENGDKINRFLSFLKYCI